MRAATDPWKQDEFQRPSSRPRTSDAKPLPFQPSAYEATLFQNIDLERRTLFEFLFPAWWPTSFKDERFLAPKDLTKQRALQRTYGFLEKWRRVQSAGGLNSDEIVEDLNEIIEYLDVRARDIGREYTPSGARPILGDLRDVLRSSVRLLNEKKGVATSLQDLFTEAYWTTVEGVRTATTISPWQRNQDAALKQKARTASQRIVSICRALVTSSEGQNLAGELSALLRLLFYEVGDRMEATVRASQTPKAGDRERTDYIQRPPTVIHPTRSIQQQQQQREWSPTVGPGMRGVSGPTTPSSTARSLSAVSEQPSAGLSQTEVPVYRRTQPAMRSPIPDREQQQQQQQPQTSQQQQSLIGQATSAIMSSSPVQAASRGLSAISPAGVEKQVVAGEKLEHKEAQRKDEA